MKNYQQLIAELRVSPTDDVLDLKIKGGYAMLLVKELEEHLDNQKNIMASKKALTEMMDQQIIIANWDDMIREASLCEELIYMRIKELKKQVA